MIFSTSFDKPFWQRTAPVIILFSGMPIMFIFLPGKMWIIGIAAAFFFAGLILYAFAYSPRKFEIINTNLVMHRGIGKTKLPLLAIKNVQPVLYESLELPVINGAFGYFGNYQTGAGDFKLYAMRKHNLVSITTTDGTQWILSPDEPDAFREGLKQLLK